jgi:hypothetical protein
MEIGQKVKWVISGKTREGVFKYNISNTHAEVMCTMFETKRIAILCTVELSILESI